VLGWILLGVVLGVMGAQAGVPVHAQYLGLAQQRLFEVGDARGKYAQPRSIGPASFYAFIRDNESGGCWLKYEQGGSNPMAALAVAPASACQ
jgi:hypothetical protein